MAKIDTSGIVGYAEMSVEDKLKALEGFEFEDNIRELERLKGAVSKANSEAAAWKKKHNELLSEEERQKLERAEKLAEMENELVELRKSKTVSDYKAKLMSQGYDDALAEETALAMVDGDTAKVFANQEKFLSEYTKKLNAERLKNVPKPTPGNDNDTRAVDWGKKLANARATGDYTAVAYYTRLQAEAAMNND